nr:DUF3305 domain-containing protein [Telmatospirillum sp. J64-1]
MLAAPEAAAPLHDRVALGLIVQRRDGVTKWQEDVWRPVEVVLNAPAIPGATLLRRSEGCDYYLFGGLGLELHRSDLASYRYNLASGQPRLWIGLRPGAGEGGKPAVVLVSAAPDEAQAFLDSGEDVVETIAMPADLRAWVESFVLRHPPPPPMRKRKRVNYDPDKAGFGRGAGEEGR